MAEPGVPGSTRRVSCILSTTQPVEAYGGFQVGVEMLEDFAAGVKSGAIPMHLHHDIRRPLHISNVESGVRERSDGEWEAWASYDVPEAEWDEYASELDEADAPGGMSFTVFMSQIEIDGVRDVGVSAQIHADAAYFTSAQIQESARELASQASVVRAGYAYQFAHIPEPLVVLQIVGSGLLLLGPDLAASWLYDALKGLIKRKREGSPDRPASRFNIVFEETAEKTTLKAHLETDSPELLEIALRGLVDLAGDTTGTVTYTDGEWSSVEDSSDPGTAEG